MKPKTHELSVQIDTLEKRRLWGLVNSFSPSSRTFGRVTTEEWLASIVGRQESKDASQQITGHIPEPSIKELPGLKSNSALAGSPALCSFFLKLA